MKKYARDPLLVARAEKQLKEDKASEEKKEKLSDENSELSETSLQSDDSQE